MELIGAFPTGRLVTFSGIPFVLSNHRDTAGVGPGKVRWNTTNGVNLGLEFEGGAWSLYL